MAIPEFDAGFLPPGIYPCTIDEVKHRFGQFQMSDCRCRLFDQLESFLSDLRSTGVVVAVIVDGSFVTAKDAPNDVDLIIILAESHDFAALLRPMDYNVLSRRRVQKRFGFDIFVAQEGAVELAEYIEFFSRIRSMAGRQKGLLRIRL